MPPTNNERISGEPPPPLSPKPKTRILSLLLVGVIMISIFVLFLVLIGIASVLLLPLLISSLHRHHRRRRRNRRHESSGGLSSRFVKKLPQFKVSEPTTRYESDCVVCFDGFRQGQWCRNLPGCGHVFHRKCVDAWLLKASTCPICRAKVRLREEDSQQGDSWRCFGHRRSSLLDL
ncbi:RING-H2 finger protein ATL56 [Cardamine amara subsp. amara]|uniref:RING-type E3 ubiquitin transferase n=1 Tax=Cardamine amara subsp. amara TaxID=228776 RepID=A0ABD1BAN8_CARAN